VVKFLGDETFHHFDKFAARLVKPCFLPKWLNLIQYLGDTSGVL
jgi:hypothetical protein